MWRFLRRLVLLLLLLVVFVLAGFRLAAVWRESGAVAAPEHGRFVETASGRIFVLEYGPDDGMPILFAHGTAAWSELWRPTLKNVADQGFRAIAYDAPPFGYSDRLNVPYTRQSLAQVVLDLTGKREGYSPCIGGAFLWGGARCRGRDDGSNPVFGAGCGRWCDGAEFAQRTENITVYSEIILCPRVGSGWHDE